MAVAGSGNKPVKPPLIGASVRLQTPEKPATAPTPAADERQRPSKGWAPKTGSNPALPGPTQTPQQQLHAAVDDAKNAAKSSLSEIGNDSVAAVRAQPTDLL